MREFFFTRSCRNSAALFCLVFFLTGCGAPDLLIVRDQYWKAADFNDEVENRIQDTVEQKGNTVEYTDVSFPADLEVVIAPILDKKPSIVVLSPLLSQLAEPLADSMADRRIIAFELGAGGGEQKQNLTRVTNSRNSTYRLAGDLCKEYLLSEGNETKWVAALFYSGGTERGVEKEAFLAGIGGGLENRVITKTFPRLEGIGEANDFLSSLEDRNIGVFFVSMSGLNREVISSIVARYPSLIVTERTGELSYANVPYSDRILSSIEEDWIGLFGQELSRVGFEIAIESVLLPGPAAFSHDALWIKGFFDNLERE